MWANARNEKMLISNNEDMLRIIPQYYNFDRAILADEFSVTSFNDK